MVIGNQIGVVLLLATPLCKIMNITQYFMSVHHDGNTIQAHPSGIQILTNVNPKLQSKPKTRPLAAQECRGKTDMTHSHL